MKNIHLTAVRFDKISDGRCCEHINLRLHNKQQLEAYREFYQEFATNVHFTYSYEV